MFYAGKTWALALVKNTGYITKCMCVSAAVSSPGTGPAGACSYHLKFNSNSHSAAVPGCDNTHRLTSQLLLCLCAGSSLSSQPDIPIFQHLSLTTSNAYSCKIQIRHTRNVLNIWIDMDGILPELQLFLAKYLRMDLASIS